MNDYGKLSQANRAVWKVSALAVAITVRILVVVGGLGTMVAGWFLHEFWLMAVMIIALVGVLMDAVLAKRGRK